MNIPEDIADEFLRNKSYVFLSYDTDFQGKFDIAYNKEDDINPPYHLSDNINYAADRWRSDSVHSRDVGDLADGDIPENQ